MHRAALGTPTKLEHGRQFGRNPHKLKSQSWTSAGSGGPDTGFGTQTVCGPSSLRDRDGDRGHVWQAFARNMTPEERRARAGHSCDLIFVPALTIHFICTGNIYRSRLAEAYCASRCVPGIHAFSSGIGAGLNGDALITPYAADVLAKYSLDSFASPRWQRTTAALVRASDVLVFMESEHHRFCEDWIEPRHKVEVWEIEDVGPVDAAEIPSKVERTFGIIRQRTERLLTGLGVSNVRSGL